MEQELKQFIFIKEVIKFKISDKKSIKDFLVKNFNLNEDSKLNLRFCILVNLNKQYFSFRHDSIKNKETKPIFDLIQKDIIKYLGERKTLRYAKEYYKEEWRKKEYEIISSTPLQHICSEFLDLDNFEKIEYLEKEILEYMKKIGYIKDSSFLSLSKISKKNLRDTFIKFGIEFEGSERIISEIINQSEFMANRL